MNKISLLNTFFVDTLTCRPLRNSLMNQYLAFCLTEVLELSVTILLWYIVANRVKFKLTLTHLLLSVLAASALTHPFAWWLNELAKGTFYGWWRVGIIELFVVLIEASFYRFILPTKWFIATLLSLICNTFSLFLGLWIIGLIK